MKSYSDMAQASPKPSLVDVPRPSSSIMMRESLVADYAEIRTILIEDERLLLTFRIVAVSSISAMNVETPFS